jgi:hypothetical protein
MDTSTVIYNIYFKNSEIYNLNLENATFCQMIKIVKKVEKYRKILPRNSIVGKLHNCEIKSRTGPNLDIISPIKN